MFSLLEELDELYNEETLTGGAAIAKRVEDRANPGAPWYTEYFGVMPGIADKATGEIKTFEDFDEDYEAFEQAIANVNDNQVIPVIFGPNLSRNTEVNEYPSLDIALEKALDLIGEDFYASNINELLQWCLVAEVEKDNSLTIQLETNTSTQDLYGTFVRISQKPLRTNRQRGSYYLNLNTKNGAFKLGDFLDLGIVGDAYGMLSYTELPNFNPNLFGYQGK